MKPKESSWPLYIKEGLGWRLSRLGEKLEAPWLVYNPLVMGSFHRMALANAPKVVEAMLAVLPPVKKPADVGCGSGAIAAEFNRRGIQTMGCEWSPRGIKLARRQGVNCVTFDLRHQPPSSLTGPFDLVYCFEVAEHLPPELGDALVRYMAGLGDVVVFSAAHPGQGGTGHINEQPAEYWISRFEAEGLGLDSERTGELKRRFVANKASAWFSDNTCVFRRRNGAEAVR